MGQDGRSILQEFYPEFNIGGFTHIDQTVEYYTRIDAILKPTDDVLDFGAGRGASIEEDQSPYRRRLQTLAGRCAHLEGCDSDPAVLANRHLDSATVIQPNGPLPYDEHSFDLILCNWVFEHIQDPAHVAQELLRVLRPGGYICALTPNRWGYIALAARLAGNSNHVRYLSRVQPDRLAYDVFPTLYRMNTPATLKRIFAPAVVTAYLPPSHPSYYFGKRNVFRVFKALHTALPERLRPILTIFIQKPSEKLQWRGQADDEIGA